MSNVKPVTEDLDLRSVAPKKWYVSYFSTTSGWVLLLNVVLMVVFGLMSSGLMWSNRAIESMLFAGTEGLLLALASTLLLGSGIFDLSIGANLVLSSIIGGMVINQMATTGNLALAFTVGIIAAIATGVVYGMVNGWVIAQLNVNSLIATLGTMGIGTGVALVITNGSDVTGLPVELKNGFGQITLFDIIPLPSVVSLAATLVLWFYIRYTRFGSNALAIGSSRSAAERAGLKVKSRYIQLAAVAGGLAGVAGVIDLARYGSTTMAGHNTDGLAAVTAVVIGGTLLEGGKVSIVGTLWGTLLSVILLTGLIVIGVPSFYQIIALGIVLIIAVALDRVRFRGKQG